MPFIDGIDGHVLTLMGTWSRITRAGFVGDGDRARNGDIKQEDPTGYTLWTQLLRQRSGYPQLPHR